MCRRRECRLRTTCLAVRNPIAGRVIGEPVVDRPRGAARHAVRVPARDPRYAVADIDRQGRSAARCSELEVPGLDDKLGGRARSCREEGSQRDHRANGPRNLEETSLSPIKSGQSMHTGSTPARHARIS